MTNLLLVYDRLSGQLLREDDIPDMRAAIAERLAMEQEHNHLPNVEVVVLRGSSREAIQRTHGRYWMRTGEQVS